MPMRIDRWMLMLGAATSAAAMTPVTVEAQGRNGAQTCANGRGRCDAVRNDTRWDRERRERARDRRQDDKVVAGVVGAAILGSIIVAAASSKKSPERERRDYCEDRYGNYDERTDTYRASDGRSYPCE